MLLVIDVGNTNVVFGIFENARLLGEWRMNTNIRATRDELDMFVSHMLSHAALSPEKIHKIVISSVVGAMNTAIAQLCRDKFAMEGIWVDAGCFGNMASKYTHPKQLGADRVVNAVAAYGKYKTSLIVIDLGTATTIDGVSASGEYLGGAICPGLVTAANALYQNAPGLPRADLAQPAEKVMGTDSLGSLQSGIIFGYAGLVDGLVNRMKAEMGGGPKVIATGGLAKLMQNVSQTIDSIEPDLTLQGLRMIGEAN